MKTPVIKPLRWLGSSKKDLDAMPHGVRSTFGYALHFAKFGTGQAKVNKPLPLEDIAVEEGSTNVYADLGYPNADEMLIKAGLASQIEQSIKRRRMTQQHAAKLLAISQRKLSDLLRGQFQDISVVTMTEYLNRLGNAEIEVPQKNKEPDTQNL
jgi:predicted XRE-type DNA-binding protein